MAKKSDKVAAPASVEAEATEKFVTLNAGVNDITVGTIPMSKLGVIRANYRKMNKQQRETLAASVDRFGFQSFVAVVRNEDGSYAIVDGHHRVEELRERGSLTVPVILLPEGSTHDRKLGMLTFNVSAEVQDEEFVKLLQELMAEGADSEAIRKAATISDTFMADLEAALHRHGEEAPAPGDELDHEGTGTEKKPKKSKDPQIKLLVLLAPAEEGGPLVVQMYCATPKDTIISREVRQTLEESGVVLDETLPVWVDNEGHLMETLAELAAGEPEDDGGFDGDVS
jgi:hypothetical protein